MNLKGPLCNIPGNYIPEKLSLKRGILTFEQNFPEKFKESFKLIVSESIHSPTIEASRSHLQDHLRFVINTGELEFCDGSIELEGITQIGFEYLKDGQEMFIECEGQVTQRMFPVINSAIMLNDISSHSILRFDVKAISSEPSNLDHKIKILYQNNSKTVKLKQILKVSLATLFQTSFERFSSTGTEMIVYQIRNIDTVPKMIRAVADQDNLQEISFPEQVKP